MASLAQLQTWLSEAETARHALAMGQGIAEVWRDGRRLTFSKSSMDDLERYIESLKREIEQAQAAEDGRSRRRAIPVRWA